MNTFKNFLDQKNFLVYGSGDLLYFWIKTDNYSEENLKISNQITIPHERVEGDRFTTLIFKHTNVIDFILSNPDSKDSIAYKNLVSLLTPKSTLPKCFFIRVDKEAKQPSKANPSDAGYDLTIIKEVKTLTTNTKLYDTGLKVIPATGYYSEIVPRSSLSKSGYMLANSVGIIDASYTGNILVALTKIDSNMPDLALPFKCCQLIFRQQVFVDFMDHEDREDREDIHSTTRNDGGFGSSDK